MWTWPVEVPRKMLSEPDDIAVISAPYTMLKRLFLGGSGFGGSDLKEWPWRCVIGCVRCFYRSDGEEVERFPL